MTSSVLVASFGRAEKLKDCLRSLARQTRPPDEVVVVWQDEDFETEKAARSLAASMPFPLKIVHSENRGIVPAENQALAAARGDVCLLIDDDARAPAEWIERHLKHYETNARIGAVGGPVRNFNADGTPFPRRPKGPAGKLTWYGKILTNMYDLEDGHAGESSDADHLMGSNFSVKREAIDGFDANLKPYWQNFEVDACLSIKRRGYKVLADFSNSVDHFPLNKIYAGGREGSLDEKIFNSAYNNAYVLSKHTGGFLRVARLSFLLFVGTVGAPGFAAFFVAVKRHGHPKREAKILWRTLQNVINGWRTGARARANLRQADLR